VSQRRHDPVLQRQHLALVALVVVATQVQDTVDDGLDHVRRELGADDHVAQLARAHNRPVFVDRERQDVGRLVLAAVVAVQLADAVLADELDRQVTVGDACGRQGGLGRAPEAPIVCLDLDQREARRSSGACRSEYSL
jgi:hypothetical protein